MGTIEDFCMCIYWLQAQLLQVVSGFYCVIGEAWKGIVQVWQGQHGIGMWGLLRSVKQAV